MNQMLEYVLRRLRQTRPRPAGEEADEYEDDEAADQGDDDEVDEPLTQPTAHAATGRPAKRKAKKKPPSLVSVWDHELGRDRSPPREGPGGEWFVMGPKAAYQCDDMRLSVDLSTLTMVTRQWRFKLSGRPIYGRISGPLNRLDIALEPLVAEEKFAAKPHGLVGQSYDGSKVPRYGRVDQYPPLEVPADFTTAAMAEGAIEGVAADYQVADKYATQFKFSRFAA